MCKCNCEFKNVTVLKKANIYCDGKVTSRVVFLPGGEKITLGIMLPDDYEFPTAEKEIMEITSGEAEYLLAGETEWTTVKAGESFTIPANSSYKINVKEIVDYCCKYIKE